MKIVRKQKAFTLVEIMIVVLIIGILLAIALPNFMKARDTSRTNSCINNLREIADAKDQWAMDNKEPDTATPASTDLAPTYIKVFPLEPMSGTYTIGTMSAPPTCSNAALGHVLPETASN
jgi:prepilin-type N-terminal cleavage/methylation domain-containing protein